MKRSQPHSRWRFWFSKTSDDWSYTAWGDQPIPTKGLSAPLSYQQSFKMQKPFWQCVSYSVSWWSKELPPSYCIQRLFLFQAKKGWSYKPYSINTSSCIWSCYPTSWKTILIISWWVKSRLCSQRDRDKIWLNGKSPSFLCLLTVCFDRL